MACIRSRNGFFIVTEWLHKLDATILIDSYTTSVKSHTFTFTTRQTRMRKTSFTIDSLWHVNNQETLRGSLPTVYILVNVLLSNLLLLQKVILLL